MVVVSRRWVWLVSVVVRRYIDFLILLIPIPLLSALFCISIPTFNLCFSFFIYRDAAAKKSRYKRSRESRDK